VPFDTSEGGPASLTGNVHNPDGRAGAPASEVSGILAGSVIDAWGRRYPKARIEGRLATEGGDVAPWVMESDGQGYFLVPGLKLGRTYVLRATVEDNGRRLSGEVQAAPPMTRLVIHVTTDVRPAAASAPAGTPPPAGKPLSPSADPGFVAPAGPPASASSIADTGVAPPRPGVPTTVPNPYTPPAGSPMSSAPTVRPRLATEAVPVSLVSGARVQEIILPDLDGGSWSFSRDRKGQLVLLDFWGTWCGPCLRAVPKMNELHRAYSAHGLEVVGVACERDQPRRSQLVGEMKRKLDIQYRVLLGGEPGGDPVQRDLRVQMYPCLVLLDTDGNVVWRGLPDDIVGLQRVLRSRLNLR
jgi:thiol-disulfide isomerase/thioredoxin